METKVIDASVIIKWFIMEPDSNIALEIREKFINHDLDLIIPHLLFSEILNGLKYSDLFSKEELNFAAESLEKFGFNIIFPKNEIRSKMIDIAVNYDLTIYDAEYVALAIGYNTQLFTADEKIKSKLPKELKNHIINLAEIEKGLKEI